MNILALDTSAASSSVALLDDEIIGAEFSLNRGGRHEETLLVTIDVLLAQAGITVGEIDLFSVTVGPGSFTGLRVGLATMKGFAFAMGKPIVAVSTLAALAANLPHADTPVCSVLDARRGDVYTATYRIETGGLPAMIAGERVTKPEELMAGMDGTVLFVGDGAILHEDLIRDRLADRAVMAPPSCNVIRAGTVGLIGLKKYRDGDILNPRELVPRYLRSSYAGTGS